MAPAITWFQIPVSDVARAKAFYETVCGVKLEQIESGGGMEMWSFPADQRAGEISGALVGGEGAVPSPTGTAVFLNANPDLQTVLDRVEPAGGRIVMPRTVIEMEGAGVFAMIADTEGNTVGLHAQG